MMERLNKRFVEEVDLDEELRLRLDKFEDDIDEMQDRLPQEVSKDWLENQFKDIQQALESIRQGVKALSD